MSLQVGERKGTRPYDIPYDSLAPIAGKNPIGKVVTEITLLRTRTTKNLLPWQQIAFRALQPTLLADIKAAQGYYVAFGETDKCGREANTFVEAMRSMREYVNPQVLYFTRANQLWQNGMSKAEASQRSWREVQQMNNIITATLGLDALQQHQHLPNANARRR